MAADRLSRLPLTPLKTWQWVVLGLGLTQVPRWVAAGVAGWLLLVHWRGTLPQDLPLARNLSLLGVASGGALLLYHLGKAIAFGLSYWPNLFVLGSAHDGHRSRWYVDRIHDLMPRPWIVSVPLWVCSVVQLAWALWLGYSFVRWAPWIWSCVSQGGVWSKGAIPLEWIRLHRPREQRARGARPAAATEE